MPIWGMAYIGLLSFLSLAGIWAQFRSQQPIHGMAALLSLSAYIAFICAYFIPEISQTLGIWSLPLLALVAIYDGWLANLELQPGSERFFKPLPESTSRLNDLGAFIIMAPAYLAALIQCYRAYFGV